MTHRTPKAAFPKAAFLWFRIIFTVSRNSCRPCRARREDFNATFLWNSHNKPQKIRTPLLTF